jgi:DNA repair protein RadC
MVVYKSAMPEIHIKYIPSSLTKVKIKSAPEAYSMLMEMYNQDTFEYEEQVIVVFFNRANNTIGWYRLSTGGMASCIIDPKKVLATALKVGAHAILISHNHPSGELKPSDADRNITRKLNEACKLMELVLLDHIIVTADDNYSFASDGFL